MHFKLDKYMEHIIESTLNLMEEITQRPSMYAGSQESAHGMLVGFAAFAIAREHEVSVAVPLMKWQRPVRQEAHRLSSQFESIVTLIKRIANQPAKYASTPESAHGMLEALAAIFIAEKQGTPIRDSVSKVRVLVNSVVTKDVVHSRTLGLMLCDESFYPDRVVSWYSLTSHAKRFLTLLLGDEEI